MFGLDTGQTLSALFAVAFAVVLVAQTRHMFKGRARELLVMIAGWLGIVLVLMLGYVYRFEMASAGNRIAGALVPGLMLFGSGGELTISRDRSGHFMLNARVRGETIPLIFDTGASTIVLTHETAERLGYRFEPINYSVRVRTANGVTQSAPVSLPEVTIGDIRERNVPALVAMRGALSENLLGMSFLERLGSYEVRGEQLILRGRGS